MAKSKKPKAPHPDNRGAVPVFAFCTSADAKEDLIEFGVKERDFFEGKHESVAQVIRFARGRASYLVVAQDLRILCADPKEATIREVNKHVADLTKAKVYIYDIRHPDMSPIELADLARQKITNPGFRDKRRAARQGAKGGTAKGIAALVSAADNGLGFLTAPARAA